MTTEEGEKEEIGNLRAIPGRGIVIPIEGEIEEVAPGKTRKQLVKRALDCSLRGTKLRMTLRVD